ncbi:MAG: transporter substrate-binding domain-containing protein, partial [Oscillospiraceae bacterium]|nr:transporter substrate-binding domain-containing protein [Oscillospiraceae bacterium]
MKKQSRSINRTRFLIVLLCWAVILSVMMPVMTAFTTTISAQAEASSSGGQEPELKSFADLSGKTVAMLTGAPFEELVREKNPDVGEIQYFSTVADMQLALKSGKIDALLNNNAVATMMVNQDSSLALFPESLGETNFGYAFAKGDPERDRWQEAYDRIGEDRINELWDIWLGTDESKKVLPAQDWAGANGTVRIAACDSVPPMSYVGDNGELTGFDIAVMLEIARDLDIHLEFTGMEFSSVMASVESGKAQVANGSIVTSEERKKLMDFVNYHDASFVLVVRSEEETASQQSVTVPEYTNFSDLSGKTVAMLTGAPFEELVREKNPDVGEIQYFSTVADMQLALKSGKIDALL